MLRPATAAETQEALTDAWASATTLEVRAGGSKSALGRDAPAAVVLDVSALSGIVDYDPAELVVTALAATPLASIKAALAERNQHLAFEPPDYAALLGSDGAATLGGTLAANLSGSRRIGAGAARDHFLGLRAVSGRGEEFKSGGRVVKNVTGYDLAKLLAGSFGTLAVLTEVTLKVLPAPEDACTVIVHGQTPAKAVQWLTQLTQTSLDISGLAHLPAALTANSHVSAVRDTGNATVVRLEGIASSVAARLQVLRDRWLADAGHGHETSVLDVEETRDLWREITDGRLLPRTGVIWKISVPPADGTMVAERIARQLHSDILFDWAGGLLWVAVQGDSAQEGVVREACRDCGGHATLVRASAAERRRCPVFQPQPPALAALSRRIKDAFDPNGILNPGRMAV
ncbi:MAG: glycolate oxidase subunit GlcE [Alphaproteobacteria bacterium]|nr:glycolate oxidase subunit GlcE [Alphaproteobacteria bacterium]